jgi:hypothetical protein
MAAAVNAPSSPAARTRGAALAGLLLVLLVSSGCKRPPQEDPEPPYDAADDGGEIVGFDRGSCTLLRNDLPVSDGDNPGKRTVPSLLFHGDRFAVAWNATGRDLGDIHLALLDASGKKLVETRVVDDAAESRAPAIAPLPEGGYLVTWEDVVHTGPHPIRARRLDLEARPLGPPFLLGESDAESASPSVVPLADGLVFAWNERAGVRVGRLRAGAPAELGPLLTGAKWPFWTGKAGRLALSWTAGEALALAPVTDPLAPLSPIVSAVDPGGTIVRPRGVDEGNGAFDLVWEEQRHNPDEGKLNAQVFTRRIDERGVPGAPVRLSRQIWGANAPDLAFTGKHVAAVFYQFLPKLPGISAAILLSLVRPDGSFFAKEVLVSACSARFPRVAWTGTQLGIAFVENDRKVRLSLVSCEGA